ncbi:hypothetical protein [Neoaquamicrobium sediminum]|uniref:hypothetical protein n=1 Tax=Neoaquamicrobium sediminum TaxID=1849104 RepID=UPI0040372F68
MKEVNASFACNCRLNWMALLQQSNQQHQQGNVIFVAKVRIRVRVVALIYATVGTHAAIGAAAVVAAALARFSYHSTHISHWAEECTCSVGQICGMAVAFER